MIKYLLLLTVLLNTAFAAELVWESKKFEALSKRLSTQKIFLKRRLFGKREITRSDLGRATSPYYSVNELISRKYESVVYGCLEITFYKKEILANKTSCGSTELYLSINGIRYNQFGRFENYEGQEYQLISDEYSHTIEGFHHTRDLYNENQDSDRHPYSKILITHLSQKSLSFSKKSISLKTKITTIRSPYTYLSKREKVTNQELDITPSRGDLVFSNGEVFMLYKRYQPAPLDFRVLEYSKPYRDYLRKIDGMLYQVGDRRRCFRDNYVRRGEYDCDNLIFNKVQPHTYKKFDIIKFDTKNLSIELI
jgi:hypothetical protein